MHLGTERSILEREGAKKRQTTNWRASCAVLDTFQALTVHAVLGEATETPNKNWRVLCAVLALKLEPTLSLSLPPLPGRFGAHTIAHSM